MIKELDAKNAKLAERLLAIQIPAYKLEAKLIGFHDIPQLSDTIETIMESQETFVGVLMDEVVVGFIAFIETERELDICRLVVHPEYFRKGIAQSLVEHVIENVGGKKKIIVSTGTKNYPAIKLYEKFGFEKYNEMEVSPGVFITQFEINR